MLLTPEQLQEIRRIIEDHHDAFVANAIGPDALASESLERLRAKGMIDPRIDSIQDSYLYGQLVAILESAQVAKMGYGEFKRYLARNPIPLSTAEHHAVQMAAASAAQYCKGLGNTVNLDTGAVLIEADAKLRATTEAGITDAVTLNIARRQSVKALKTDLGWMAKDWARDWDRIAVTEKQNAMQHGQADHLRKQYGEDVLVARRPMPDSCQHCRRVYTDPNGQPRIFKLSTLEANGTNVGRKAVDWKAVVGTTHPWCQCQTVRIPAGWGFNDEGDLEPGGKLGYVYDDEGDLMLAMRAEANLLKAFKLQGHVEYQGLSIAVENRKGSVRKWKDADGNTGETRMKVAYGYLKRTRGADSDEMDCFVGPDPRAENVYVVEQLNPSTGVYDEQKVFLGFGIQDLAIACYRAHYDRPDKFILTVSPMKVDQFKRWIGATMPAKAEGLQKGLHLVVPFEKAGPYIGPRGGKWADIKHTIPWKEPKKIRTGLIDIPESKIREITDNLLEEIVVDGRDQVRKMVSNFETTTLTTPTGETIPVSITFLPTSEEQGPRGISGNARTEMRWNEDGSSELKGVTIRIKAKKMVWDRKELAEQVRSVLDHELTHSVDPTIIEKLRKKAMSIAAGKKVSADKPLSELTDKEYINKPTEITARMRQIARDILDKKTVEEILDSVKTYNENPKTMPWPHKPGEVIAWSPTWQFIEDHLTDKNRKRVLKMVASLVEGIKAGKLEPIEKALMETGLLKAQVPDYIGASTSPAGNRAPGPGIGANYVFLPRPKRERGVARIAPGAKELMEDRPPGKNPLKRDKADYEIGEDFRVVNPIITPEDFVGAADARKNALANLRYVLSYGRTNVVRPKNTAEISKAVRTPVFEKAMFVGPRGGRWQDAAHTIPWKPEKVVPKEAEKTPERGVLPPGKTPREHVAIAKRLLRQHTKALPRLKAAMSEVAGKGAEVQGRCKTLESALGKLVRKPDEYPSADTLQDITGTRVIHGTVAQVKATVTELKARYKVVDEDDYIEKPQNSYRSYHLILEDPDTKLAFEVQVRTKNQDTFADWAHNVYKPVSEAQAKHRADPEVLDYEKKIADHFWALDTGAPPPPCTPVIRQAFGCL